MKFKEFFKLTKVKIIYLIIILLTPFIYNILTASLKVWSWGDVAYKILTFGGLFNLPFYLFISGYSTPARDICALISSLIFLLILHYLLISLIVWIFRVKIKKK